MLRDFATLERPRVEIALEEIVDGLRPTLGAVTRYAVGAGGKRVRPLLVVASYRAAGGMEDPAEGAAGIHYVAAAVELVHTYSLLHDDLPVMDDDDLRRGLPTAHRVYGARAATAAGPALQQLAFLALARAARLDERVDARLPELTGRLARAAGVEGMVGGQYMDLEAERGESDGAGLEAIHRAKTASLIGGACAMGGLAADGLDERVRALAEFGTRLGLCFQIVDDVLDETGDAERMGKSAGADRARGKATYPAVHGLDEARRLAAEQAEAARTALEPFAPGGGREVLEAYVRFVLDRSV